MKRIKQIFFATCTWVILSTGLTAHAEVDKVVLARQFGIGYLQLAVMDQMKLVEKHLASVGLSNTKVEWARFASGSAANDAMLSGRLHFAAGGTGPAFILWDKTRNNAKVHGVAALSSMPNLLVTRDPKIKTISDFGSNNKIAMAGAGSSVQTTYLQMAAAKTWGIAQYKKLDTLMVNLPHPEGLKTMLSGGTEVTSTFTTPPFQYMALENKDVRIVLNSGKETAESILKMLNDPDIQITLTPEKVLPYAQFMQEVGTLKNRPEKWTDLFFPELHSLPGS